MSLLDMRPRGAGGGSGAPADATFITQIPNATLTNEQALSLLATGLLKNTTGTGVLSIGAAGTDYLAPAAIGVTVQAWDADLDTLAGLAKTDGNFIVGDGVAWVVESGATARTSLGLGTIATQNANNVTISGGSVTGITDLAIADGGTGQSTAQAAIDALTNVVAATNEHVLTKDTATGNAIFKASAGGSTLPVADTQTIIKGSGDPTKLLRFEIDGFTAGATRVLTPPNADATIAGLEVANVFTAIQKINVNNALALLVEQDGVKDNVLIVDTANGRVGVNTVPSVAFHVAETMHVTSAAGNPSIELRATGATAIPFIDFAHNASSISSPDYDGRIGFFNDNTFRIIQNQNNELQFYTSNSVRMKIGGGGHVAINNSVNTSYYLDVGGNVRVTGQMEATSSIKINDGVVTKVASNYFSWDTGIRLDGVGGRQLILGNTTVNTGNDYSLVSADKLSLYVSGYTVEAIRVLTDGKVGINDTTPDAKLDIVQSSATGAIPVLKLEQADLSEEFIRFETTVGAGNAIDTAALGAYYGKVRVYVEGVGAKWLALYD